MRYISDIVKRFLNFLEEHDLDPLSPLSITITVEQAREIDAYYKETIAIKNEEIRKLKEVIVQHQLDKLN